MIFKSHSREFNIHYSTFQTEGLVSLSEHEGMLVGEVGERKAGMIHFYA